MCKPRVGLVFLLSLVGNRLSGADQLPPVFRTVVAVQEGILYELTMDGQQIRSLPIPSPAGHWLEAFDLIMDRRGLVHVFREGDSDTSSFISTYDPQSFTWTHTDVGIWYGGVDSCFDLSIWEDTLWTTRRRIDLPQLNHVEIDSGLEEGACLLAVGRDGLLYEVSSNHPQTSVRVLDPTDLSVVREPIFRDEGRFILLDIRGITATADGEILVADWDGRLALFDSEGNLIRQVETPVPDLTDLDLAEDGTIVGGSRSGEVVVSDLTLSSAISFPVNPSSRWNCFVAFTTLPFPVAVEDDCNRNQIDDRVEVSEGVAEDCNEDFIPDECELGPRWTFHLPHRQGWPSGYRVHAMADLDRDGDDDVLVGVEDTLLVGLSREGARFEFGGQTIVFEDTLANVWPADFDADRIPDIAVLDSRNLDELHILFGEGNGSFTDRTTLFLGERLRSLITAHFNRDLAADIAVVTRESDGLLVFLSQGRTFAPGISQPIPVQPGELAAGDFDRDGHRDLVVAGRFEMTVLAGSGDGRFTVRQSIEPKYSLEMPRVTDLNGDRYPDLLALSPGEGTVVALLAQSDGRLSRDLRRSVKLRAPGSGESVKSLLVLDTNRDRLGDIVVYRGDWIYVYEKEGDLGFGTFRAFRCTFEDIVSGDVNNDGMVDLVNRWGEDALLGQGDGSFRSLQRVPTGMMDVDGISAADVNDDSITDLVAVSETDNKVLVMLGEGGTGYAAPRAYSVQPGPSQAAAPVALVVEDFNGDGLLDAATLNELAEKVALLTGDGRGGFSSPRFFEAGRRPVTMTSGDLDDDGEVDLVVVNEGDLVLLFGNGAGSFSRMQLDCEECSLRFAAVADFNGDDLEDIAVTERRSGRVLTYEGTGGRGFRQALTTFEGMGPLIARDLDGDGHQDLVFWTTTGDLSVPWGRGDGTFDAPSVFEAGRSLGLLRIGCPLEASDIDGDGVLDVVTGYGGLTLLRGNGDRTLAPFVDLRIDPDSVGLLCADLDRDGDQDILTIGFTGTCCHREYVGILWNESRDSNDCNGNGVPDDCDVKMSQLDRDRNRIPDACQNGGLQLPGDCNQDFVLDISDATCLLGALFLGEPASLPCGDGTFGESSNVMLLDFQPDGSIDVSDGAWLLNSLFVGGRPHWLLASDDGAAACVPIVGCPDRTACE